MEYGYEALALLGELPPGVCPLYFPVLTDEPLALVRRLQQDAVSAIQWWDQFHPAVPWQQFAELPEEDLETLWNYLMVRGADAPR